MVPRAGAVLAMAAGLLGALLISAAVPAPAEAKPFGKQGVVHACAKVAGKNRGALRLVNHPRACKRMRGWHRMAWTALGAPGAAGAHGAHGGPGAQGAQGGQGATGQGGVAGEVTALTQVVNELTGDLLGLENSVNGLLGPDGVVNQLAGELLSVEGDLLNLEGTVEGVCSQLGVVTEQTDDLLSALGGLSLNGVLLGLGGLLNIPTLPDVLGNYECL